MVNFYKLLPSLLIGSTLADVPSLTSGDFDSAIADKDLALVKFFAPWCGHCKSMASDWVDASNAVDKDKVLIAEVDCTGESGLCGKHGVAGYPTLKSFKKGKEFEEFYDRKKDAILNYVKKNTDGGAPDAPEPAATNVKSEDNPGADAYTAGKVWKVVGSNFVEKVVKKEYNTFIKVYAPWCGHCVAMSENWDKLAETLKDVENVKIAKIDATANDLPSAFTVRGYPTLFWVPAGADAPEKYQGARSVDAWMDFIKGKDDSKEEL